MRFITFDTYWPSVFLINTLSNASLRLPLAFFPWGCYSLFVDLCKLSTISSHTPLPREHSPWHMWEVPAWMLSWKCYWSQVPSRWSLKERGPSLKAGWGARGCSLCELLKLVLTERTEPACSKQDIGPWLDTGPRNCDAGNSVVLNSLVLASLEVPPGW